MRQAAEEAIASGTPVSRVCRMYGLSRGQWRHHKDHGVLADPRVESLTAVRVEVLEGGGGPYSVIPRLESLLIRIGDLRQEWSDRPQVVVSLLRLERDVLGDVAKLRGEFPDKPTMTLDQLPQWQVVLAVLDNHPKARTELVKALRSGQ